jgi:hypothetical protein
MFTHRYISETDYQVVEHTGSGERIIPHDQHDYLKWRETTTPKIEATGRFLSVVDNQLVVDPNKASILAAEEAARQAEKEATEKKVQDIILAKEQIAKIESDVGKAGDITALKATVIDLIKQVRILVE